MAEKAISQIIRKRESGYIFGWCQVCNRPGKFLLDWKYSYNSTPNFRERLVCSSCGLNNRQRYTYYYLRSLVSKKQYPNVLMFEQVTNFYKLAKGNLNAYICGSEYLGYNIPPGEVLDGIRHEDACNLSFENECFDIIISNDVFEHVSDIHEAIKETYRVLKRNGTLIFTIPFFYNNEITQQRAIIRDGEIVNLLEEQYHGNPLSDKGCLVFYDFGWDIIDMFINYGFSDCYMLAFYSILYGYIGNGLQFIFIAEK